MKELSIEEKAKAYDEAKARIIRAYNSNRCTIGFMNEIFPELKESEDERIRKALINKIKCLDEEESKEGYSFYAGDYTANDCIAWLEKQGENANFRNKIQIGDQVTRNEDGVFVNLSQLKRVSKSDENQVEQKPADKVIEEEKPLLEKFKQAVYDCAWEKVTCKKEGETKEEYANRWAEQFLLIVRDWADDYIDFTIQQKLRNSYDKGKIDIIEKQGEQKPVADFSDLRTWKYIVDAVLTEKEGIGQYLDSPVTEEVAKKLQKRFGNVEQKPVEWRPSKEVMDVLYSLCYVSDIIDEHKDTVLTKLYQELKREYFNSASYENMFPKEEKIKQSITKWNEEDDKKLSSIINLTNYAQDTWSKKYMIEVRDWLKSIKDRVQPKQEWGEDFLKAIIRDTENND